MFSDQDGPETDKLKQTLVLARCNCCHWSGLYRFTVIPIRELGPQFWVYNTSPESCRVKRAGFVLKLLVSVQLCSHDSVVVSWSS